MWLKSVKAYSAKKKLNFTSAIQLTLTLLKIVPVSKNNARVSTSMMLFGDFFTQNINNAKNVTNGKNGLDASSGDRILPVLYLYDL